MTNFLIALTSMITPWTLAVVILCLFIIAGGNAYLAKLDRDRAEREIAAARREDERREHARQILAADIAYQRTRETERRMRAADRDGAA
jgi:hypothetical protein